MESLLLAACLLAAELDRETIATLEKFAPHASGVCLAEVLRLEEVDWRPMDGPLFVRAKLLVVRGSGSVPDSISIVTEPGGAGPPRRDPPPRILKADSLQPGVKYWFALCSPHQRTEYPEGVIDYWLEDTPEIHDALMRATLFDHYRWQPAFDPKSGLTYGRLAAGKESWQIRVEKNGKVLWETTVPGVMSARANAWGLYARNDVHARWTEPNRTNQHLCAETATILEAGNDYHMPPGKYYVLYLFDLDTGHRAAIRILEHQPGLVTHLYRAFDPETNRKRGEERYESIGIGGYALGGGTDGWLIKTVSTFDPQTGSKTGEELYRHGQVTLSRNVTESRWNLMAKR